MSNSRPFYAEYGITTAEEFRAAINEKAPIKLEPTSGQATELDASTIAYCDSWLRVVFKGEDKQFIFDESNGWSIAEVKHESSGGGEKELPTPASTDAGKLVVVGETGDYEMIDAVYGIKPKETLVVDIPSLGQDSEYPAPALDEMEFEPGQEIEFRFIYSKRGKDGFYTISEDAVGIYNRFVSEEYIDFNNTKFDLSFFCDDGVWSLWIDEEASIESLQVYLLSGGQKISRKYLDFDIMTELPSAGGSDPATLVLSNGKSGSRDTLIWRRINSISTQYVFFDHDGSSWTAVDSNGNDVLAGLQSTLNLSTALGYYQGILCKPMVETVGRPGEEEPRYIYHFTTIDIQSSLLHFTSIIITRSNLQGYSISGSTTSYALTPLQSDLA